MPEAEAHARCWFVDSEGLVVQNRPGRKLAHHKLPYAYAHIHAPLRTLAEAVEVIKPTMLVGVSGQPATFTPAILRRMAELHKARSSSRFQTPPAKPSAPPRRAKPACPRSNCRRIPAQS